MWVMVMFSHTMVLRGSQCLPGRVVMHLASVRKSNLEVFLSVLSKARLLACR